MTEITVKITGVSRGATLTWNHKLVSLADAGGGNLSAVIESKPGTFLYAIVVFGSPGDPWTGSVSGGVATFNHAGHMSPAGFDTTGDTAYTVQ
jgi:hypothetical protein